MTDLVTRLRAEIDEDVNEPLDWLLAEAADRIASDYRFVNDLTRLEANHFCIGPANELVSQVGTAPRKHKWGAG
jgi:hypothetical protein